MYFVVDNGRRHITQAFSASKKATAKLSVLMPDLATGARAQVSAEISVGFEHFLTKGHVCPYRWVFELRRRVAWIAIGAKRTEEVERAVQS